MDYKSLIWYLRRAPNSNIGMTPVQPLEWDAADAIAELIGRVYAAEKKIKQLTPCDRCEYDPPSSGDGKPCSFCPASKKEE